MVPMLPIANNQTSLSVHPPCVSCSIELMLFWLTISFFAPAYHVIESSFSFWLFCLLSSKRLLRSSRPSFGIRSSTERDKFYIKLIVKKNWIVKKAKIDAACIAMTCSQFRIYLCALEKISSVSLKQLKGCEVLIVSQWKQKPSINWHQETIQSGQDYIIMVKRSLILLNLNMRTIKIADQNCLNSL